MQFPPPPASNLDWANIGFVSQQLNGHIECRYNVSDSKWTEPELVLDPFLRIHGLSPALNYGQQAYEGMKAYRDPDGQIYIFRPEMHAERMNHSAMYVSIPSIPTLLFKKAVHLAVSHNAEYVPPHSSDAALYIRPVVFGSCANLPLSPPNEYLFCVYVQPLNAYHGNHAVDALIMEEFDRAAPKGTGNAKVGGNYAPVMRWSEKAKKEGFGITLHLDSMTNSEIDEFSTSGFIGVLEGQKEGSWKLVVPDSKSVIKSITSDTCLELAKTFGWEVEMRPIKYAELPSLSEVIAVGTAAALVPIRSITRATLKEKISYHEANSGVGPCCKILLQRLQGVQRGLVEDTFHWREHVSAPEDYKRN